MAAGRARGHGRRPAARRRRRSTSGSTRSTAALRSRSSAPAATPPSSATARTGSRTAPTTASPALDRLGRPLRPDRLRVPANTTTPPTASWRKGPVNVPLTARRPRRLARAHRVAHRRRPELDDRQLGHRQRHGRPPARDRRGRRRRQPHRAQRHRPGRQHASGRHHDHPRRLAERRRRRPGRPRPTPTPASTASSGRSTPSRPAPAPRARSSASARTASTTSARASSTRSATRASWVDHTVMVNIAGPGRHDRHPERLDHRPVGRPRHHRRPQRLPRHPAHPVAARRRHHRRRPGHRHDARDGHRRRRPRARGADHRRLGPHQRLAHAPGQDRHGRSRSTTRPSRPAGSRSPTSTCSCAAPTSTRRSRASSGASTAATSSAPPRTTTRSASRATAPTRSRPASSTTPAGAASGRCTRSGWTRRCRPTPRRPSPAGWRNTPYSVVLNGSDAGSGVSSVRWRIDLEDEPAGDELEGTRDVARAEIDRDGSHTLQHPHPRRRRQLLHLARRADPHRPRAPDRRHGLSVRAGRQPPRRHLQPAGRPLGRRRRSSASSTTAASRPPPRRRSPAPARTRCRVRVRDNAGNWSAWADHAITVVLGLDTTAPTDTTVDPDAVAARRLHGRRAPPTDDIDGTGVDYVQWRYGNQPAGQGPNGSEFTISDRRRARHRDARGRQGRQRDPVAPPDAAPGHDRSRPRRPSITSGWTNRNTFTLQATDATSGVANIEYKIGNAAPIVAANGADRHAPERRRLPHQPSRARQRGPVVGLEGRRRSRVDTVLPVNTSAAAPTTWQTTTLALALTGTDAASGVDHAEWRVNSGTIQSGSTTAVSTEGIADARDADRRPRRQRLRPGARRASASTAPSRSTPRPRSTAPWRKTNFTTTVTGSDASPGSGVARVEYKVDNGSRRHDARRLDHDRGSAHALHPRRRHRRQRVRLA